MQLSRPYIGVTGVTTRAHAFAALDALGALAPSRLLMLGFLQSHKSVRGVPLRPPWNKRTPALDELADLLIHDSRAINMVHYAPGDATGEEIAADLHILAQEAGLCLDGFQLNGPLPDPVLLTQCRDRRDLFPRAPQFVLQVNRQTLAWAGDIRALMHELEEYVGLAHYVLFDMSDGRGKALDVKQTLEFLRAHRESGLPLRAVVAGGLGPKTYSRLAPVFAEFPDISTDMEGACMGKEGTLSPALVREAIRGIAALVPR